MNNIKQPIEFLLFLWFFVNIGELCSQDRHLSQMYFNPLELSPSNTGMSPYDYRLNSLYRSQWSKAVRPYVSYSIAADTKLLVNRLNKGNILGIGIQLDKDIAGEIDYQTVDAKILFAYGRALNKKASTYLSVGTSVGYVNEFFDREKIIFGNQISNGLVSDFSTSNEKNILNEIHYLDFSAGMSFFHLSSTGKSLYAGIQMSHLNQPKVSFLGNDKLSLPILTKMYLGGAFNFNPKIGLILRGIFLKQDNFNQFLIASMLKFYFSGSFKSSTRNSDYSVVYLGIKYRVGDALILAGRIDIGLLNFTLSYDLTSSQFAAANSYQGAFEIGVNYQFSIVSKKPRIRCPRM